MAEAQRGAKFPWHCSRAHKRLRSADDHKLLNPSPAMIPPSNPSPGAWRHGSWQNCEIWASSAVTTLCSLDREAPGDLLMRFPFVVPHQGDALGVKPASSCSSAGTGRQNNLFHSLLCPSPSPKPGQCNPSPQQHQGLAEPLQGPSRFPPPRCP